MTSCVSESRCEITLVSWFLLQIARNITTNELANAARYGYLRGPDGRLQNPYNRGCQKNCTEFFINGYVEDEGTTSLSSQQKH